MIRPGFDEGGIAELFRAQWSAERYPRVMVPDLLPHVSVKRIVDWGADAVKILIYYTPFEDAKVNDIKHAFIERIGA